MSGDLVGVWDVALSDGVHRIEFEHGTTTGKRVISVDGKEVLRRDWMFKLVGKETFYVGSSDTKATINIDAVSGFAYEYTLEINGKSLKKYMENRSKVTSTWLLNLDGVDCRVVLEKDTMDIWCNGQKMETAGEFVDDGTETHFTLGDHDCCIKAVSSGRRRDGIIHALLVDGNEMAEANELSSHYDFPSLELRSPNLFQYDRAPVHKVSSVKTWFAKVAEWKNSTTLNTF